METKHASTELGTHNFGKNEADGLSFEQLYQQSYEFRQLVLHREGQQRIDDISQRTRETLLSEFITGRTFDSRKRDAIPTVS